MDKRGAFVWQSTLGRKDTASARLESRCCKLATCPNVAVSGMPQQSPASCPAQPNRELSVAYLVSPTAIARVNQRHIRGGGYGGRGDSDGERAHSRSASHAWKHKEVPGLR